MTSKKRTYAYLALLGNALLWGLALPIVKKGYTEGLTPSVFLTTRMFLAGLLSLPLLYSFRHDKRFSAAFTLHNLSKILSIEVIGNIAALFLLYRGLQLTTAIESTLIGMTIPVFTVLGGIFFLREKEEKHEWLGLFLALFGTMLLIVKPLFNLGINGSLTGNLFILAHNLLTATYFLLAKKHYHSFNKFAVSLISFWLSGFAFMAIYRLSLPTIFTELTSLTFWPIFAIIYMATLGSIAALTLYHYGLSRIEAGEASIFTYLQPVFAIPISIILIGESISIVEILATTIIILGVYLAEKR